MSLREKISSSQVSSDLSEAKTSDFVADVDVIRACGLVAKNDPIGLALWRLKFTKDTAEIKPVISHFVRFLHKANKDLSEDFVFERVKSALKYWIDPVCDNCDGLGYLRIVGCPTLSDQECAICKGAGKTIAPAGDDYTLLLNEIDRLERQVASKILKKLAKD